MAFDRAEHCRKIASKGGKALVAKYGREHMRHIGRKGFEATSRHFRSVTDYKLWLGSLGAFVYWRHSGLPPKFDKFGHSIFPQERPPAPWDSNFVEF